MRFRLLSKKVIEFGLPAVILMLPLLINPYGYHVYELPKVVFFRFAILLIFTAWLVDAINSGELTIASFRRLLARPIVPAALVFTFICVLSTVVSVDPRASFWGSYRRLQGTYSLICCLLFFFLIVLNSRTKMQFDRLITTALLASLPIALYGVLQHSGFNPIFTEIDFSQRVTSIMGNPIFLGAYLVMVIPFALGRLLVSLRALLGSSQPSSSRRSTLLEVIGYSSLLLLQLMCLLYTKARGPWFGLLGGTLLFAVLIALRHRMRRLLLIAIVAGVALIGLLVALNLPNTPLEPFTESPYLSRLVFSDELAAGTGTEWVRLFIWQGTLELIKSRPDIGFTPDPLRPLRYLIGYGPETMEVVYPQVYPPELAHIESREAIVDRAHNQLLDLAVTTGALGLLAFLFLMGSFFYFGVSLLWRMPSFNAQITLIALLSAVAAHLVESQLGIPLTATSVLLWLYLALMTVMYASGKASVEEEIDLVSSTFPSAEEIDAKDSDRRRVACSLLIALIIPFFASFTNINPLLADIYLDRAIKSMAAGEWKQGIAAYDKAIRVFPSQSKFHQLKANAYYQLAQGIANDEVDLRNQLLQDSADALAEARELQPLEPEYYAGAGKLYGYWARTVDPSKFEPAVEFYERALQLSPHSAVYRNELARVYFDAGRYEDALRQLQLSLEIDPEFYATHYNLGLAYLEFGERYKAEEHFKTALLLDPGCGECIQKLESLEGD